MDEKQEISETIRVASEELEEQEEKDKDRMEETFDNIENIMRFLDGKIITDLAYVTNSRGNLQVVAQYFEDPGILIYENKEHRDLEPSHSQSKHGFNEQENIPEDKLERLFGEEIFFTREGEFWVFTKDEIISPTDPTKQKITLVRSKETSIEDIIQDYPDFVDIFYGCFKKVVIAAIEKSPKKRAIFQKIIDHINRIEENKRKKE